MVKQTMALPKHVDPKLNSRLSFLAVEYERVHKASTHMSDLFQIHDVVFDRWEIIDKIGKGAHGEVYRAKDIKTDITVAIKTTKDPRGILQQEIVVYKKLLSFDHFPMYIFHCTTFHSPILVLEELGPTFSEIVKYYRPLRLTTVANIALQLLDAIESLHRIGYMHSDIKANNVAIGTAPNKWRTVYLFDFSLAQKLVKKEETFVAKVPTGMQQQQSGKKRTKLLKDDLYAILRFLLELRVHIHFLDIKVPGHKYNIEKTSAETPIKKHLGDEFIKFKHYTDHLGNFEMPDYGFLKCLIEEFIQKQELDITQEFDWECNPCYLWLVLPVRTYRGRSSTSNLFRSKTIPPKYLKDTTKPENSGKPQAPVSKPHRTKPNILSRNLSVPHISSESDLLPVPKKDAVTKWFDEKHNENEPSTSKRLPQSQPATSKIPVRNKGWSLFGKSRPNQSHQSLIKAQRSDSTTRSSMKIKGQYLTEESSKPVNQPSTNKDIIQPSAGKTVEYPTRQITNRTLTNKIDQPLKDKRAYKCSNTNIMIQPSTEKNLNNPQDNKTTHQDLNGKTENLCSKNKNPPAKSKKSMPDK